MRKVADYYGDWMFRCIRQDGRIDYSCTREVVSAKGLIALFTSTEKHTNLQKKILSCEVFWQCGTFFPWKVFSTFLDTPNILEKIKTVPNIKCSPHEYIESISVTAARILKTDSSFKPALVRPAWGQFQVSFSNKGLYAIVFVEYFQTTTPRCN